MASLRRLVFDAMDNAVGNGHAELMRRGPVATVAVDLFDYDSDIANATPRAGDEEPDLTALVPHIQAWRNSTPELG